MIYIGSPYTANPELNYRWNLELTGLLMKENRRRIYYNPICYGHQFKDVVGIDFKAWYWHNLDFMKISDSMLVLCLDGWEDSAGLQYEIDYFKSMNKPVTYMTKEHILNILRNENDN